MELAHSPKRHAEDQIIAALKEAQAGSVRRSLYRRHCVLNMTFSEWQANYAGLDISGEKKLRQRKENNRRWRQIVTEQALVIQR